MVEALVMTPLLIQAVPETVKLVVEALVEIKLVPLKLVVPETVKFPPIYTFPEEWTERRFPGLVVPMPTLPFPAIYKLFAVAPLLTTKAPLFPMVSPPVMVEVEVVLVTLSLLIQAVSEIVR